METVDEQKENTLMKEIEMPEENKEESDVTVNEIKEEQDFDGHISGCRKGFGWFAIVFCVAASCYALGINGYEMVLELSK